MVKKIILGVGLSLVVLLLVGFVVTAADLDVASEVEKVVEKVSKGNVSKEVSDYVESFAKKKNVEPADIKEINEVDFEDLPKEVNIENVGDHNLAIYEIDYADEKQEDKKLFVVTYSVEKLKAQGDLIVAHDKRQFLNFGFNGEMSDSGFLKTAAGVEGSSEKGYVMMRYGSITGLSTNLEVVGEGDGQIEIIIYKNGEPLEFRNALNADLGVKNDYDIQSNDVVTFEPGDVISVYADAPAGIVWKDVINMVEITTLN